jgi:hypothetical protein
MKKLMEMANGVKVYRSTAAVIEAWQHNPLFRNPNCLALYNGLAKSIITERALMGVGIDDHMVCKGHAVFDTLNIVNGRAYLLDKHLTRFMDSIKRAGLNPPCPKAEIETILLTLAACTKQSNLALRYWCSKGPVYSHSSSQVA